MIDSWSKLKGNVSWDWISTPPYLTVLARIKRLLPVKYHIILFKVSVRPILEYCVSVLGSCNAE